jgi:NifU-like protein involved in Fe-S cluster formation
MSEALYNLEILRLAASTGSFSRLTGPQGTSERRSPTCGSRVTVDIDLDDAGFVARVGQEVRACALGQASAALLAQSVIGKSVSQIEDARNALGQWLAGSDDLPREWPGLNIFAPALPHRARHAAILLAFEAAAEAAARAAG